ncbi:MAG: hypothetical protein AAFN77_06725 [Planctomycetota bacterium]
MDTQPDRFQQFSRWLSQPRVRAFGIAIAVLAVLAILEVNNLKHDPPMVELLSECQYENDDLQRIQIAFGQAGLSGFEIRDQSIVVPADQHAAYLKVAGENHAVPQLSASTSSASSNILMTRQQQKQQALNQKKMQVREMVMRLPFVEQAFFEMDQAESSSPFRPATQKAVVSIRCPKSAVLTDRHIETVRQMISAAVANLEAVNIVVIDLENGLAQQEMNDELTIQQVDFQRMVSNQQRFYESRIREALNEYPGLQIQVNVEMQEAEPPVDQIAHSMPQMQSPPFQSSLPAPGANGVVSLEPEPKPAIMQVSHQQNVATVWKKQIAVTIDVPESVIDQALGENVSNKSSSTGNAAAIRQQTANRFQQMKRIILQKLAAVLPSLEAKTEVSKTAVNLIPSPPAPAATSNWSYATSLFVRHWPSVAVVLIGLTLLTMVTRTSATLPTHVPAAADQDVLSIQGALADGTTTIDPLEPEVRLSQMIEDDPDAAAKIIETWIRDAA